MIYTIGNIKLSIPEQGEKRKIRTPRQVVPWRDVAETCRTIDALLPKIFIENKKHLKIIDGIARAGFWSAVLLNYWPNCELIINENDNLCTEILEKNFPKNKILKNDIYTWKMPTSDLVLLDFDDFTLKKSSKHKEVLKKIAPKTKFLMVADNTCFGFKFGNMRHYGVKSEKEYYELLNKEMKPYLDGKKILAVSYFVNAAMILYGYGKKEIEYISPSSLFLSRGNKLYKGSTRYNMSGFGLCG